jgi:hypothetical protein
VEHSGKVKLKPGCWYIAALAKVEEQPKKKV